MPYDVRWLLAERVIHLHVHGSISPYDAQQAYDSLAAFYATGKAPVHLVLEHTGLQKFPLTLNLYNFIIDGGKPSNAGWMLIVGTNRQAHFIGRLFSYVSGMQSDTFNTLDEAGRFLLSKDHTLNLDDA